MIYMVRGAIHAFLVTLPCWLAFRYLSGALTRRMGPEGRRREFWLACWACYLAMLFAVTLFPLPNTWMVDPSVPRYNFVPLHESLREILGALHAHDRPHFVSAVGNLGGNVLMFMPFGFLLPMISGGPGRSRDGWTAGRILLCTVLVSTAIELMQAAEQWVHITRTADIDDIILNSLGGLAGYAIAWRSFGRRRRNRLQAR